jgi:hypothetical protein
MFEERKLGLEPLALEPALELLELEKPRTHLSGLV